MLDRDADFRQLGIGKAGVEPAMLSTTKPMIRLEAGSSNPASMRMAFTAESNSA